MQEILTSLGAAEAAAIYGLVGVALQLGAYAALQLGFIRGVTYSYGAINALGAALMLLSLQQQFNLAAVVNNTIWLGLSLIGLTRLYLVSLSLRMTYEDQAFLREKFPALEEHSAKRLLDLCVWSDVAAGEVLTREGAPVQRLVYLAQGAAAVYADEKKIGDILDRTLVGEFTVLDGAPATATVVTTEPSRILQIEADALRRLARSIPDIGITLHETMMRDARAKLMSANAQAHRLAEGFRDDASEAALREDAAQLSARRRFLAPSRPTRRRRPHIK